MPRRCDDAALAAVRSANLWRTCLRPWRAFGLASDRHLIAGRRLSGEGRVVVNGNRDRRENATAEEPQRVLRARRNRRELPGRSFHLGLSAASVRPARPDLVSGSSDRYGLPAATRCRSSSTWPRRSGATCAVVCPGRAVASTRPAANLASRRPTPPVRAARPARADRQASERPMDRPRCRGSRDRRSPAPRRRVVEARRCRPASAG